MDTLETAFSIIVTVLAALAVVGALVFALVWEVCAIRRTLDDHRRRAMPPARSYWREHAAVTIQERRP